MLYLITKALLSGVIIMAASEVARRSPTYGALLVSLPLISILAMIWLWRDTGDNERIAALSEGTFWLVLPTLPMFVVLSAMLRNGFAFWTAVAISCALTVALYCVALSDSPKTRDQSLRLRQIVRDVTTIDSPNTSTIKVGTLVCQPGGLACRWKLCSAQAFALVRSGTRCFILRLVGRSLSPWANR